MTAFDAVEVEERLGNDPTSELWGEHRSRYRFAAQFVTGKRVLDVACGSGFGLGMLRAAAFRGETIHALTGPLTVEPRGDRYVARFTVTLTSGGKLLPAQIGIYEVETAWRKDGDTPGSAGAPSGINSH